MNGRLDEDNMGDDKRPAGQDGMKLAEFSLLRELGELRER